MQSYKTKIWMLVVILLMQIILPTLTIVVENEITTKSIAATTEWDISKTDEDNVKAVFDDETGTLTISGTGAMTDWAKASDVHWYSVRNDIKNIVIGAGVTNIGEYAFSGSSNLLEITIPNSVTSIERDVFRDCSSLTRIAILEGVEKIADTAFFGCTSLIEIKVAEGNEKYTSEEGILYDKNKTTIIYYPAGKTEIKFEIPSNVTSIGSNAFDSCSSLSEITIPEGVTRIGDYAFCRCSSLTEITIPEGVTGIAYGVFWGCSNLTKITILKGVTYIGQYAFNSCSSLSEITIPEGVTRIGDLAFSDCSSLTEITIPNSVTSIGSTVFGGCSNLTKITIPENVTNIASTTFSGSSLIEINVAEGNGKYSSENGILYDKNKTEIIRYPQGKIETKFEIPESVISIDSHTFTGCGNLIEIIIPSSVTAIGDYAFSSCSNLTEIIIPEGVTSIGNYAFYCCSSLTEITIPNSVITIGNKALKEAKLTKAVKTGEENIQELELPDIIKRATDESDILYTEEEFTLKNCSLSEDKTKLIVDTEVASTKTVSLKVTEGALEGLTVVVVVPSGTITYSTTNWTKGDVTARIYIAEGEKIQNNNGESTYIFTENGTFTFEYLTAEGESKTATATVSNIFELEIEEYEEKEESEIRYLTKINPQTTIPEMIENIKTNGEIKIYKGETEITDNTKKITTGMEIKIIAGEIEEKYIAVVTGDVNGDGEANIRDILAINKHRLNKAPLTGAYLLAGNVTEDENVDIMDILQINKYRLGKIENL